MWNYRLTGADGGSARASSPAIEARAVPMLRKLAGAGLLQCVWTDEAGAAFSVHGLYCDDSLAEDEAMDERQLSAFAYLRWKQRRPVIQAAHADVKIELLRDSLLADLSAWLGGPGAVLSPAVRCLVRVLMAAGLLTRRQPGASPRADDPLDLWEFHDLLFHRSSRTGGDSGGRGGTFRFAGLRPPAPALRQPPPVTRWLPLDLPPGGDPQPGFFDVLAVRRSLRPKQQDPITLAQLAAFLWHSARVKTLTPSLAGAPASYEATTRPYPSGGACHALELYPCVQSCRDLEDGLYYYDPFGHRLGSLSGQAALAHAAHESAKTSAGFPAPVVILVTSRFERVMWKYEGLAYALILKDLGGLYQTFYLVATALGLSPCALGAGLHPAAFAAIGTREFAEEIVGEFALAGPASCTRPR